MHIKFCFFNIHVAYLHIKFCPFNIHVEEKEYDAASASFILQLFHVFVKINSCKLMGCDCILKLKLNRDNVAMHVKELVFPPSNIS